MLEGEAVVLEGVWGGEGRGGGGEWPGGWCLDVRVAGGGSLGKGAWGQQQPGRRQELTAPIALPTPPAAPALRPRRRRRLLLALLPPPQQPAPPAGPAGPTAPGRGRRRAAARPPAAASRPGGAGRPAAQSTEPGHGGGGGRRGRGRRRAGDSGGHVQQMPGAWGAVGGLGVWLVHMMGELCVRD